MPLLCTVPRSLLHSFRVDFIVVLESLTSLVLKAFRSTSTLDISALRALRVLRPLRAITYIPQVVELVFRRTPSGLTLALVAT